MHIFIHQILFNLEHILMLFLHFNASVGNPVNGDIKILIVKNLKQSINTISWEKHHEISTYDCISKGRCSTALPAAYSFVKHWPALWLRHTTRWSPAGCCSSGNACRRAPWPSVVKDFREQMNAYSKCESSATQHKISLWL